MTSENKITVFTAIELPQELSCGWEEFFRDHTFFSDKVRWVRLTSLHLTLHYFADISLERIMEIQSLTSAVVSATNPFDLALDQFGFFPNENAAKVFWIGVKTSPALERLQKTLDASYRAAGFMLEDRPFKAHITLGRFKSSFRIEEPVARALEAFAKMRSGVFRADVLKLFKSPAEKNGYPVIDVFQFQENQR